MGPLIIDLATPLFNSGALVEITSYRTITNAITDKKSCYLCNKLNSVNLLFEGDPRHVIQVENLRNQFHPPVMLLSQYLERIR